MLQAHFAKTLGILLAALAPAYTGAQSGDGRSVPPGVYAPPRPASRQLVGFGTLRNDDGRHDRPSMEDRGRLDGRAHFRTSRSGFGSPFLFGSTVIERAPAPVPIVVPYAVPYYYPVRVPVRARPTEPPAPATPYNPANSKTLIVGAGVDGGGGVMRIERLGDDTLRVTWRGTLRPIREAWAFLTDSLRQPLRRLPVTLATPSALFTIGGLERQIAYTGLTVVYADGATTTTLVPYRAR